MVTIKDTKLGSNGGVFESILDRLQSKTSTTTRSFLSLSNSDDDAFASALTRGTNERGGAFAEINNRLENLNTIETKVDAAKGLRDRADALAVDLTNASDGTDRANALQAEATAISNELVKLGAKEGEIEDVNRPDRPRPGRPRSETPGVTTSGNSGQSGNGPGFELPGNRQELTDLKTVTQEERGVLREQLQENNKQSDALGDEIDKQNEKITRLTERETALTRELEGLQEGSEQFNGASERLARIGEQKSALQEEVAGLTEQKAGIDETGKEIFEAAQTKSNLVTAIDQKLDALNTAEPADPAEALVKERAANEKRATQLEKQNEDLTARIGSSREELVAVDEQLTVARENPDLLTADEVEGLQKEKAKIEDRLGSLTEQKNALSSTIEKNTNRSTAIDEEVGTLRAQVLTSDQKKESNAQLKELEDSIEKPRDRLAALEKTDRQLAGTLGKAQERLEKAKSAFEAAQESGADRNTLTKLRKVVAAGQKDVTGLERDRERIQSQVGKIQEGIAGTEKEIGSIQDRLAKSEEAESLIAERTQEQETLTKETGQAEKDLAALTKPIEKESERLAAINDRLQKDTDGRARIGDLESRQTSLTEGIAADSQRQERNTTSIEGLRSRNVEIDRQLAELEAGRDRQQAATPAEARERLENRQGTIRAELNVLKQDQAALEEENTTLRQRRSDAEQTIADSEETLKGLRTNEELDAAAGVVDTEIGSASEALADFDKKNGKQLDQFRDQEAKFRAEAVEARANGQDNKADAMDKVADGFAEKAQKIEDKRAPLAERLEQAQGERVQIDEDRTLRSESEARIETANSEIASTTEALAQNEERLAPGRERIEKLHQEDRDIEAALSVRAEGADEELITLEKRRTEIQDTLGSLNEEAAGLGEQNAALQKTREEAEGTIAAAKDTLAGLRTADELDKDKLGFEADEAAAVKDLGKFDDKNGKKLEVFQKLEEEFRAGASIAREKGLDKVADVLDKVADKFGEQVQKIETARAPIVERLESARSGITAVETDRQLRSDAETELGVAEASAAEATEKLAGNADRSTEIESERQQLSEEAEAIEDRIAGINPSTVDTSIDPESLTDGERRDLAKDAGKELLKVEDQSDRITRRIEKLAEKDEQISERIAGVEEKISTLTGQVESGELSREEADELITNEQERLEELTGERQSVRDQQVLFGEKLDALESRGVDLENFVGALRGFDRPGPGPGPGPGPDPDNPNPDDPGPGPRDPDPDPGPRGGVEETLQSVLSAVAGLDDFIGQNTAVASVERACIQSRVRELGQDRDIDIFAGRIPGLVDPAEEAGRLAESVRDQILQLAQNGNGSNAISAAISDSTDVGKLSSRLSQLFI